MKKQWVKAFFRLNILSGILIVFLGLFMPALLRLLFGVENIVSNTNRFLVLILQMVVILIGVAILFKGNTKKGLKHIFFGLMAGIIIVGFFEAGLQLTNIIFHIEKPKGEQEWSLQSYKNNDWAKALFKESHSTSYVFEPYTIWRRAEFRGQFINIDKNGVRRTWNPPDANQEGVKKIYMFGGSSLWGTGARDEFTIASYLAKMFYNKGIPCVVTNYGESGYTFMQEIIRLLILLNEGHRPDIVLFYDGFNDIYSAYNSGKPGTIQNLSSLRNRFENRNLRDYIFDLIISIKEKSMLYKVLDRIANSIIERENFREKAAQYSEEELLYLGKNLVKYYYNTIDTVERFSNMYGFSFVCIWQPVLYTEKKILEGEGNFDPRFSDKAFRSLYLKIDRLISSKPNPHLVNIKDTLYERVSQYYFDLCHTCEKGNDLIAERIFHILEEKKIISQ